MEGPMSARVTLIVEFDIGPGRQGAYRAAVAALRHAVGAQEPGMLTYDWWVSEDGQHGVAVEVFRDSAALVTHMGSHASLVADLLDAASLASLKVLGPPTPEGRAAIEAAASGFYSPLGGIERRPLE